MTQVNVSALQIGDQISTMEGELVTRYSPICWTFECKPDKSDLTIFGVPGELRGRKTKVTIVMEALE